LYHVNGALCCQLSNTSAVDRALNSYFMIMIMIMS